MPELMTRVFCRAPGRAIRTLPILYGLAAITPPLWAQTGDSSLVLEEILVTAQKRPQNLMDVGISVAVAGAQQLRERRITAVTDISLFTPNASVKEFIPGLMPIITIRGVGLNDFNAANNPATGVYIDEVSLSSLALLSSDFFDLERMEVLKGPQGTLYGRNSTAGALNIVTAKPDMDEFGARLSAGAANYDTLELEGMLNTPVSDNAALRVAVKGIDQGEGYWDNEANGKNFGQREVLIGRGQLRWRALDNTEILLKLEKQRNRSELGSAEFFGALPGPDSSDCPGQPECTNFLGYSDTNGDPWRGAWSVDPEYNLDQLIASARVDVDFQFGTLTSVTGYIDFERDYQSDVDASPDPILDFIDSDEVEQFSQEFRLAGQYDDIIWLVGAFYSKDEVTTIYEGELQALLNTSSFTIADLESTSQAVFANVEWPLSDTLTLNAGLRATDEERANVSFTSDLVSEPPASFLTFAPFGSPPVVLASTDDSIDDSSIDWKLGLNWSPEDSLLVFLSASKGTKSGGFFTGVATSQEQLTPYDKETLTAYELGIKHRAGDISYESSLFYYDYEDVQTYISDNTGAVPVDRLGNVDGATVYGLDLLANWTPSMLPGLALTAGLGLLDTELESFEASFGTVPKGNELPDAPELSGNLELRYAFDLTESLSALFALDGRYQRETFHDALNNPLLGSESYWVINGRVMLYLSDHWEFSAWGRNLADEEYVMQGVDQLSVGNGFRVYGARRTYGATVTRLF